MAIVLISNITNPVLSRGDIAKATSNGHSFGAREGPPNFVKVNITDATLIDVMDYVRNWTVDLRFDVVNSNIDGYRLRLYSNNVSSLKGFITRDQVENLINDWSGSVESSTQNEVIFDIGFFNTSITEEFLERDSNLLSQINFSQVDITATDIQIQADYSSTSIQSTGLELFLIRRGATINSHDNRIIVYTFAKDIITEFFKQKIKQILDNKLIEQLMYYVSESVVDNIIAQGYEVDVDLATFITYVRNKLDD